MDNESTQPKNDGLARELRIPVLMSREERDEVKRAAREMGVPLSTFIRLKVLQAVRDA